MRVLSYIPAFLLILSAGSRSQAIHIPIQVNYLVTGAYSNHFQYPFSFGSNQAALASRQALSAACYSEKRFSLDALGLYVLSATMPAASGALGFQLLYFGSPVYHESKLGLAFGRRLGKLIDLGIQFSYYFFQMAGYGQADVLHAEMGIILHASDKISLGLQLVNPGGASIGKWAGERLAYLYKTGIGYEASEQVYFQLDLVKAEGTPVNAIAFLQYRFADRFFAGLGLLSENASPFGKAGWKWKNIQLEVVVHYHPQLGFSPGISLLMGPASVK